MPNSLLFQASAAMSSRSATDTFSPKPLLPVTRRHPYHLLSKPAVSSVKLRRRNLAVRGQSAPTERENDSVSRLERCFALPVAPGALDSLPSPSGPVMKGQYGALGAVTLEKSKLDTSQKQTQSKLDIGGGDGGIGKHINHGGGDGGDDGDDDDDDYFDDFDEGHEGDEGGLFRRRILLEEF